MVKELFMSGLREMEGVMAITATVTATLVPFTQFPLVLLLNINFLHGMLKNVHQHWQLHTQAGPILTKKL